MLVMVVKPAAPPALVIGAMMVEVTVLVEDWRTELEVTITVGTGVSEVLDDDVDVDVEIGSDFEGDEETTLEEWVEDVLDATTMGTIVEDEAYVGRVSVQPLHDIINSE